MITIMLYHALIRGSFYTRQLLAAGMEQTALGALQVRDDLRLNFYSDQGAVRARAGVPPVISPRIVLHRPEYLSEDI